MNDEQRFNKWRDHAARHAIADPHAAWLWLVDQHGDEHFHDLPVFGTRGPKISDVLKTVRREAGALCAMAAPSMLPEGDGIAAVALTVWDCARTELWLAPAEGPDDEPTRWEQFEHADDLIPLSLKRALLPQDGGLIDPEAWLTRAAPHIKWRGWRTLAHGDGSVDAKQYIAAHLNS